MSDDRKRPAQVRLSHITFSLLLEELLSGPCTAKHLAEHTGMTHRYMCTLLRTMQDKKVIHISGWDKDALGRSGVRVYSLGYGKAVKRPTKTRQQINRDYRAKAAAAPLKGTPFQGLGA